MTHHSDHEGHEGHHHEMPTEGRALTGVAISATLHCLTGCAIGEVAGMVIGTALGFSDLGTIALAVALAFLFGYTLTSFPLLRAGFTLSAVIPIALAADTLSIAVMEIVDNGIMLAVPGAMEAGVGDLLFWGALSVALAVAFVITVPVNRWLIGRGRGHVVVHETGIHGGPSPRTVGTVLALATVFGVAVLVAELVNGGDEAHGGHQASAQQSGEEIAVSNQLPGVASSAAGLRLELETPQLRQGEAEELRFRVMDNREAKPVTDFQEEHERRMHLIVVRRDLTGFQHLHPTMEAKGTWRTRINLPEAGSYRVFADFRHEDRSLTLGSDLQVDGEADYRSLPAAAESAETDSGYQVMLRSEQARAGQTGELAFTVTQNGKPVHVEPYLGADGHLVALREGDLAFLHVHPLGGEDHGSGSQEEHAEGSPGTDGEGIRFMTEFPTDGRYRLFLQFQRRGDVHTAAFTREVEQ